MYGDAANDSRIKSARSAFARPERQANHGGGAAAVMFARGHFAA
jgi:hypothetical protein